MGQTRFLVPRREHLPAKAAERAYLSGLDDIPWKTRVTVSDDGLLVERAEHDSGNLNILWKIGARGEQVLTTTTLSERPAPYNLPVELARGIVNRVRANLSAWDAAGLTVPPEIVTNAKQAMHHFIAAIAALDDPPAAADQAQRAIELAAAAGDLLMMAFAEQAARMRSAQSLKLTILFGGSLGEAVPDTTLADAFLAAFNTAVVPLTWGRVEAQEGKRQWSKIDGQIAWCLANELRVIGGPLVELDKRALPDFLYLWEGDFDRIFGLAAQHVAAVVNRYKGRIHLWNCAARVNTTDTLTLTEEQSLRLSLRCLELVRQIDPKAPVVVSFDQPWGEYMSRRDRDLSPLQFADALVRADLGLSGIALEMNLGVGPRSTLPRDVIEIGRQLDRWTTLGLPLVILLTIPSAGDGFTAKLQQAWLDRYLQLFSAKAAVHAVFWNQFRDELTGESAHRGLLDPHGQPNATFAALTAFRKRVEI